MAWVRNSLGGILLLVFLLGLITTAVATSGNINLSKPYNLEIWLANSDLYKTFLATVTSNADKAATTNTGLNASSLGSVIVQQSAATAFSEPAFEQYVNTIINSNYAWLEGTTPKPTFAIDLSNSKATFANQIGLYVEEHLSALTICSPQELAAFGSTTNTDPLSINCRPSSLNVETEGTTVSKEITNSNNFLINTMITADNLNPQGRNTRVPYYVKLSHAPTVYKYLVKTPWIFGIISLLCAIGAFFLITKKKRAIKFIGAVLVIAGLLLIVLRLVLDKALASIDKKIFAHSNLGQIQVALVKFLNVVAHNITRPFLWFGGGYIFLAILLLIASAILKNRQKSQPRLKKEPATESPSPQSTDMASRLKAPAVQAPKPMRPPINRQMPALKRPEERPSPPPRRRPPTKLIQ